MRVSMFEAELNGKDSTITKYKDMEDVLTSNVFGTLKNIDNYFLNFILKHNFDLDANNDDLIINFWKRYDENIDRNCEPDVIISSNKFILFIEAKYGSEFGEDKGNTSRKIENQLVREYDTLCSLCEVNQHSYLLIITSDLSEPIEKIKTQFHPNSVPETVKWTSWQKINTGLKLSLHEYNKCKFSAKWIIQLCELLDKKNLNEFSGFSRKFDEVTSWRGLGL